MRILITGASSRLAQAIANELKKDHDLRLMDTSPISPIDVEELEKNGKNVKFMPGSILDPDDSWKAVRGIEALIHTCEPPPKLPRGQLKREQMMLDFTTRGTHNIFGAAIAAGVKKFICAGTLAIFSPYPDDVYISELWKPLPSSEIYQMTKYLGELTCREFARDYMVTVTCLRLGELVLEEEVKGKRPNLMWLDIRDAAQAFRCALNRDRSHSVWWQSRWAIYHVCADLPNPKFLINQAVSQLGYKPAHNFRS